MFVGLSISKDALVCITKVTTEARCHSAYQQHLAYSIYVQYPIKSLPWRSDLSAVSWVLTSYLCMWMGLTLLDHRNRVYRLNRIRHIPSSPLLPFPHFPPPLALSAPPSEIFFLKFLTQLFIKSKSQRSKIINPLEKTSPLGLSKYLRKVFLLALKEPNRHEQVATAAAGWHI